MPVNLQLQQIRAPRAGIGPQSANVGRGLASIGQQLGQSAQILNQLSQQTKKEDPVVAQTWYLQKIQQLDQAQAELRRSVTDPFEFNEASQQLISAFSNQSTKEARELGIPNSGVQKLTPRLIKAVDDNGAHRTRLFTQAGQDNLRALDGQFQEYASNLDVGVLDTTTQTGPDSQRIQATIRPRDEAKANIDLFNFAETAKGVAEKYGLNDQELGKFLEKSQGQYFEQLKVQALAQNPERFTHPKYSGENVDFSVEQIMINPQTGELERQTKTMSAEEAVAFRKHAFELTRLNQSRRKSEQSRQDALGQAADDETTALILLEATKANSTQDLMDIVGMGGEFQGVSTKFHDPKNKLRLMEKLEVRRQSGGFVQTSDSDIREELMLANVTGELIDANDVLDVAHMLSDKDQEFFFGEIKKNRGQAKTQAHRDMKEQLDFTDDFWGNFTKYAGSLNTTANALALKSKTQVRNRVEALDLKDRTREKLQEITLGVLEEEARLAVLSRIEVGSLKKIQEISHFTSVAQIEETLGNPQDKALALFMLKVKSFRQEKQDKRQAAADAKAAEKSNLSNNDILGKAWGKFLDKLPSVTDALTGATD